jgi:hypothetical protein
MSTDDECEKYEEDLAELALGILTGRQRVATLAHVESCARCTEELEQLSRAADAVVLVAPEADPPIGFEVSLFSRMGVDEVGSRRRSAPPRWMLAGAAALIALGVGLGVGLSMGSHRAPAQNALPSDDKPVLTAKLVEDGTTVGRVSLFGGSKPMLTMTLSESAARGKVVCQVVTSSGTTRRLGTFTVSDGYGDWVAPLWMSPDKVTKAQVASPSGTVIATASLG